MKIGEVARETGLSEKAIRLYVENGLVKPTVTQSTHRNSYDFSRENIRQLERIAIFRKAGFSLFEISVILEQPERLPELLDSKRQSMEADLSAQAGILSALDRLQSSEIGDVDKVTQTLRFAVASQKEPATTGSGLRRFLAVTAIVLLLLFLGAQELTQSRTPDKTRLLIIMTGCLLLLLGLIAFVMALRYATCPRRCRRLPQHGVGTVISVREARGFDIRFARAGTKSAGTREPGIGGIWQIFLMLWGEIRPDVYAPVIRYTDENGTEQSDTFCYGGFRRSWETGQQIKIAWNPKHLDCLYPLEGKWLAQKAWLYGIPGVAAVIAGLLLLTRVG